MSKNMISELIPEHEGRKSYYGKATIRYEDNMVTLASYFIDIIEINKTTNEFKVLCKPENLSNTTLRHLREFLKQNELGHIAELTKKEIIQSIF